MAKIGDSALDDTDDPAAVLAQAITIRHREWLAMHEERERFRARWADFFRDYDILLCPPMSVAAIEHDHSEPIGSQDHRREGATRPYFDALIAWAGLIGMVYLTSTRAPVGRTNGNFLYAAAPPRDISASSPRKTATSSEAVRVATILPARVANVTDYVAGNIWGIKGKS